MSFSAACSHYVRNELGYTCQPRPPLGDEGDEIAAAVERLADRCGIDASGYQFVMWDERLDWNGDPITGAYDDVGGRDQILLWSGHGGSASDLSRIDWARTIAHEHYHHLYGGGHGNDNPFHSAAISACTAALAQ